MKLRSCTINNFASYDELEFKFNDLGLTLVHGSTGSGKSTLLDFAVWILYGHTSKDGNVDEIRSWNSPDEVTKGLMTLQGVSGTFHIRRSRGKPSENDLYIIDENHHIIRGKDITETQALIDQKLGVCYEAFIAGSYFNEFSPTGSFFTAKGKERRELFERLADLSLPITLIENTQNEKKTKKKELEKTKVSQQQNTAKLENSKHSLLDANSRCRSWDISRTQTLQSIRSLVQTFEEDKQKLIGQYTKDFLSFEADKAIRTDKLSDVVSALRYRLGNEQTPCSECGQLGENHTEISIDLAKKEQELSSISKSTNPITRFLENAKSSTNHYTQQLEQEEIKRNPFIAQIDKITRDIEGLEVSSLELSTQNLILSKDLFLLDKLQELCALLRIELLKKSIHQIQESTNQLLEKHFDAELRVKFELEDGDNLAVNIQKNGHDCVYKQLSKGQRQLLKLTFALSVMKASANKESTHFNCLFFDEALDGLDSNLKVKAFSIFQELEKDHESILLVDHAPEFQNLFNKKLLVTMSEDISTIEEVTD